MASDNAMTEIALALAMAFFSIMILTMVSMGAGDGNAKAANSGPDISIRAMPVQAAKPASVSTDQTRVHQQDKIIIFHNGVFYDPELNPADPRAITVKPPARVILAISPDLSMAQALDARSRFASRDVIVTTLSNEWTTRLKEISR
jgi:hypothetical protein